MKDTKNPFLSLTNWSNAIITLIGVLSLPELKDVVPLSWLPYILLAVGVLNLILRNFFTSKPTTEFAAKMNQ